MPAADVALLTMPHGGDSAAARLAPPATSDPFSTEAGASAETVLPQGVATARPKARLTAILVANGASVAVIDDEAVSVGDKLRTGERVASIQPDRVWVVQPNGQWHMLRLAERGQ